MSYQEWQRNGWLRPHQNSPEEIAGLLAVIERDLKASADPNLDGDWRFAIAYNAALQQLTDAFAHGSSLSQLRANEAQFGELWQLRQWVLDGGVLRLSPTPQTPDESLNGSAQQSPRPRQPEFRGMWTRPNQRQSISRRTSTASPRSARSRLPRSDCCCSPVVGFAKSFT